MLYTYTGFINISKYASFMRKFFSNGGAKLTAKPN